ncbi:hypothetical protein [Haloglomus litoreum]|uniref:hypothetical protein n=1 Tax=Haloglomus litoreum TaxID=3034026 RepID=UPI0023E7889E|nr:hypothetical protein [Haloglomus sp. DT116]
MTEDTPDETRTAPTTLGEVSHTNPFTGEVFGSTQTYDRGRTIAADGGADPEREAEVAEEAADEAAPDGGDAPEREELRDVEHTPPGDAEGTNGVYERGHEGREENR